MEQPSDDHKDFANQHENSHKLWDEKAPLLSLKETQWKPRKRHDQNFLKEENSL